MSATSRPRRHPESAYRAVGDEGGLVVVPGRGEVQVLNPVGTRVFALLDGEHTVEQIVQEITREFDVGENEALADVQAFLGELAEAGMLDEPREVAGERT